MKSIKDISTALSLFQEAAMKYGDATQTGNYRIGNKNYDKLIEIVAYLKETDNIDELLQFLNNDNAGIRLAAAVFVLSRHEEKGVQVLEELSKNYGLLSSVAEMTLSEWRKGNLKL